MVLGAIWLHPTSPKLLPLCPIQSLRISREKRKCPQVKHVFRILQVCPMRSLTYSGHALRAKVPPLGADKMGRIPRLLQSSEGQRSCSSPAWSHRPDCPRLPPIAPDCPRLPPIAPEEIEQLCLRDPCDVEPATPMRNWSHDWIHSLATPTCRELAASSLRRLEACSSLSMAVQPAMGEYNWKQESNPVTCGKNLENA